MESLLVAGAESPMERIRQRAFALMVEGASALEAAVEQRGVVSEHQGVKNHLTMRVGLVLDPPKPEQSPTQEFMNRVSASNPQYTGWPIWLDTRSFRNAEDRAHVLDGVWQALILGLDGDWFQHFEFLRFDPEGKFYLQRVMEDDLNSKVDPGVAMDRELMIYRIAEALAVGLSMARQLEWDMEGTANFGFKWTGLKGRKLYDWASPGLLVPGRGCESHSSGAEAFVQVPMETPHSALAPFVRSVVGRLFALFDGYEAPRKWIDDCVQKMTQRKIGS